MVSSAAPEPEVVSKTADVVVEAEELEAAEAAWERSCESSRWRRFTCDTSVSACTSIW